MVVVVVVGSALDNLRPSEPCTGGTLGPPWALAELPLHLHSHMQTIAAQRHVCMSIICYWMSWQCLLGINLLQTDWHDTNCATLPTTAHSGGLIQWINFTTHIPHRSSPKRAPLVTKTCPLNGAPEFAAAATSPQLPSCLLFPTGPDFCLCTLCCGLRHECDCT